MTDATRRAVAYIAARMAGGRDTNSVYDFESRGHFSFSGTVEPGSVNIFDYSSRCHIGGSGGMLYHFGTRSHFNLEVRGSNLNGYDFLSRSHFTGSIYGSSVSIYDYETRRYHRYSV